MNNLRKIGKPIIGVLMAVVLVVFLGNIILTKADETTNEGLLDKILYTYLQIQNKKLDIELVKLGQADQPLAAAPDENLGAVTLYIENYIPAIKRQGSIQSTYDFTTSGAISGGALSVTSITNTGALTVSGATVVGTFTQGGGTTASGTIGATGKLSYGMFDTEDSIDFTPSRTAVTLTIGASSTITGFSTPGQSRIIRIKNGTTTPAIATGLITIAAGTGETLYTASGTSAILTPGKAATLRFYRLRNNNISVFMDPYK
jgi:hypothetical protein